MRIGLDISQIAHGGGVGVYTENLARNLLNVPDLDLKFFYSLLRKPYKGNLPNVKKFFIPPTLLELLFNEWRFLPVEVFLGDIDIFHSTDWMQPPTRAKKVTTYHDLIPIKFPQWSYPRVVKVHKRRLKLVESEIDMVIAVSQATKKDLLEVSRIPEEKIVVIYEGVDEKFSPQNPKEIENFREKYNLPQDYVLAIGGVGERKNLSRIKDAAKKYPQVILGETIKNIPDEEMPFLYSGASVLVYASLYEGFGLPILEAMACGTPVITSNISSMPEVGGDAPLYVNPESVIDIENAIRSVLNDSKRSQAMIEKGFKQARKFSWKKCAEETAEVYRNL